MSTRLPFVCLPANEQARARAMFFDARDSDGYLYELDRDGHVLCRNRSTADLVAQGHNATVGNSTGNYVEVIKEVEFSSALAHEQSRYVDLHLMAGFAISAQPKAGGGWVVRVLRLVG